MNGDAKREQTKKRIEGVLGNKNNKRNRGNQMPDLTTGRKSKRYEEDGDKYETGQNRFVERKER